MPVQSRLDGHIRDAQKSAKLLEKARNDANKTREGGYCSAAVRAKIRNDFAKRNPGKIAHEWQVNIGEALELGLDCSLLAGTGSGKTIPFVMPLFSQPDKIVIIISPLNALEEDQAKRFQEMGIPAVAINGDTYNDEIHKEIEALKKKVIITSPNMCLKHERFRKLLSNPKFADKIAAFVIDEAHCITQWGDKFRTEYAELGTLRAFVPVHVPFLVASATLPPPVLAQVRKTMHISADNSYHVNLGTDRPNIAWICRNMKGAKSDLEALDFLVDAEELTQTMVFFDDINLSLEALKYLRARLPDAMKGEVAAYSSRRTTRAKRRVMDEFRRGKIKILLTTEAAGMGCDMPYIEQVVQFMVPASLSIWMQRAGRAGRTFTIFARAILLVQPSVFQEIKTKNGAPIPESEGTVYRKDVEEGLRHWIETENCRREVIDEYFDSGVARQAPTGICCDNCLRKTTPDHPLLTKRAPVIERPGSPASYTEDSPRQEPDSNGKRGMNQAASVADRRDHHLQGARTRLQRWRLETWKELYIRRPWGHQVLLPDKVLTTLATKARFTSVEDLIGGGWGPTHARKHGPAVLEMLCGYDMLHREFAEAEKEERARLRREQTIANRVAKKAEAKALKERAAELRRNTQPPPKPRASRAKKPKTQQENIPPLPLIPHTPFRSVHSVSASTPNPFAQITLPHLPPFPTFVSHTPLPFLNRTPHPSETPQNTCPATPMPALDFSPYMDASPVQHGFYASPHTQVPDTMGSYRHYSFAMNPPPHLQPPHASLTQNSANTPTTPTHFYGAALPERPKPRPLYKSRTSILPSHDFGSYLSNI